MADTIGGFGMQLVVALIQLVAGLLLSMGSVYIALKMYDKLTPKIDEWKELKRGNAAVGIVLSGVIIAIAIIIQDGVAGITSAIAPGMDVTLVSIGLVIGVINLLISVLAAVVSVYVAVKVLDWITVDMDEMEELKKGNVAIAIFMASVLVAVSFVIRGAVAGITQVINAVEIFRLLGL
jgi:uncharacterized membrane protein YjfL (UPF0719 family)